MSDNQSRGGNPRNFTGGGGGGTTTAPPSGTNFPRKGVNRGMLGSPRGQPPGQYSGQPNDSDSDFQKGFKPSLPTPVMHHAERKHYDVGTITNEEQDKRRQFRGILYKLTPQNFEKLLYQVKQVNIDNADTLRVVVLQIYEKALMEPTCVQMYANFCSRLSVELPDFSENNEKITFKKLLLNKCQDEFKREGEVKQTEDQRDEARRRRVGNIRLIGELYKKRLLTERIMHECIKKLLGNNQTPDPDEENIEVLCKLMSTIGEMIDHPKVKEDMDVYFDMIFKLSNNMDFSSRVRFMLKDVIDLRNNKWQQRMKVEGPEKKCIVRREAAQERQGQATRVAREPTSNRWARRAQKEFGRKGSNVLPSTPQMGGYRRMTQQIRAYGNPGPSLNTFENRPWSRARVTMPPQSGPLDKVMSGEQLHDMSIMMIKEFYSARDVKEVVLCIRDLNAPSFYPSMISIWVIDSFERKDVDRDSLTQLLINLAKSQDGILSQDSLVKGFESVLSTLEDAVNDAPKAAEFLGRIFAKVLLENVISYAEVWRLIYAGGEEQGRLVEIGLAAEVLGVILEIIKLEKGDPFLNNMRMGSDLRLENFRPPTIKKTLRLDKFI
uniref:eukaryotic translation initiation factor 4G-like n=1 Tax=Erigeron canadensis TaxID=72917 RepID=UPI001CB8FD48|nr:eukaryotic translation initiation factor 4G-like [Erigeron canadensis]